MNESVLDERVERQRHGVYLRERREGRGGEVGMPSNIYETV